MKTYEAIQAIGALTVIAQSGKAMPLKFAYAAARNRRALDVFIETYNESRNSLLKQHGKPKDDGDVVVNDKGEVQFAAPEDRKAFDLAHTALLNEDVPDLKLHQVALTDFPADIDLGVMDALMPMVMEAEAKS